MGEKIKELRNRIDRDIERKGGMEEFNGCDVANEIITSWIYELLNILEEGKWYFLAIEKD